MFWNISKDWSVDNMKRTGLTGYVYGFSVDHEAIAVDDIKNIHKYLMNENDKWLQLDSNLEPLSS